MPNRLINENSPYLLQHADNPVDWYPWGKDALTRAQVENKPIFLSIGYAACHWCHVMAHESFSDQKIATILNDHFISIKVDREERPDLDNIYMKAATALTGQGGWPLTVFLTPEGKPFFAGTYFPPVSHSGLPAFVQVLEGVYQAWQKENDHVEEIAQKVTDFLTENSDLPTNAEVLDPDLILEAVEILSESYDWESGGWGRAPKFPQPLVIDFLLQVATRGNQQTLKMAEHALDAMCQGGMYDLVNGGFHRYSTDNDWYIPHFEKMLYDNAQLARAYLHAYCLTRKPSYRAICEKTLDFIASELTSPQGGFYSSLDADSAGGEGSYYLWTPSEIKKLLSENTDRDLIKTAFGLGQVEINQRPVILRRRLSNEQLSQQFAQPENEIENKVEAFYETLQKLRQGKPRPATDDKVLVAWNGLAIETFAEAARFLNRQDYLQIARDNASFLLANCHLSGKLRRSWRAGQTQDEGFLEDYASLILALLKLFQCDPDPAWFDSANILAREMTDHYSDESGGFYDTRNNADQLLFRPKDIQDNVTPSGNAMAANALLRLSAFSENDEWSRKGRQMFPFLQNTARQYPGAFAYWLATIDFTSGPIQQVAVLANPGDPHLFDFSNVFWQTFRPRAILACSVVPPPSGSPSILQGRDLNKNQATAFVCEDFTCRLPTTSRIEFQQLLDEKH